MSWCVVPGNDIPLFHHLFHLLHMVPIDDTFISSAGSVTHWYLFHLLCVLPVDDIFSSPVVWYLWVYSFLLLCVVPVNDIFISPDQCGTCGWYNNFICLFRVPLRSRHFLSQKLWHFHKNIHSFVENECCRLHTVNIPNVNFTLKISIPPEPVFKNMGQQMSGPDSSNG